MNCLLLPELALPVESEPSRSDLADSANACSIGKLLGVEALADGVREPANRLSRKTPRDWPILIGSDPRLQ